MSDRSWIIECVSVVAWRLRLNPGEFLVVTQSCRLVITDSIPEIPGLLVVRTSEDRTTPPLAELVQRIEDHVWANIE